MNAESMNNIGIYKSAKYLSDFGFENINNSYLNEFPEISHNNSQSLLSDFIFPKINKETLPLENLFSSS